MKPKKTKKIKDPNEPKRIRSSFIYYCQDNRSTVVEEFKQSGEDFKQTEVMVRLGQKWKLLEDDEKTEYIEQASNDRERRTREMESYTRPSDEELEQFIKAPKGEKAPKGVKAPKSKKAKVEKDPLAPKRARSSYIFYCLEKREEAKTIVEQEMISSGEEKKRTSNNVMKKLGEMWKLTTTTEREEFNYKALVDKDRYKQELILRETKEDDETKIESDDEDE